MTALRELVEKWRGAAQPIRLDANMSRVPEGADQLKSCASDLSAALQAQTCAWTEGTEEEGYYSTSCGHLFTFNDDGPKENQFAYCPYCGGALVEPAAKKED